jgi:hypothetical protein
VDDAHPVREVLEPHVVEDDVAPQALEHGRTEAGAGLEVEVVGPPVDPQLELDLAAGVQQEAPRAARNGQPLHVTRDLAVDEVEPVGCRSPGPRRPGRG